VNNQFPISESIGDRWTPAQAEWFLAAWQGLSGWKKTFVKTTTIDFASVNANSQSAASTLTITGVRRGDVVKVQAYDDTVGIDYKGFVTANDTVSIFAYNFTTGAINPASTTFKVTVFQN
jgi:hypothetical protein